MPKNSSPVIDACEKISKISIYLLVFLLPIFFLPLTINPVEINKQALALILIIVAFICYLVRSINSGTIVYPKNLLSLAVLTLLIAVVISAVFSKAGEISIFGSFDRVDSLLSFIIYGLAFFLSAVLFKSFDNIQGREDFKKIGLCFLGGFILSAIFGLFQVFGKFILPFDFMRSVNFNTIGSALNWGIFIAFGLVMIITLLINFKITKYFKIILFSATFLTAAALLLLNYQLIWIELALIMFLLMILRFAVKTDINLPLIILAVSLLLVFIYQQLPSFITMPVELRPNVSTTLIVAKDVLLGNSADTWYDGARQIIAGSGPATFGFDYTRFRPINLNQTNFWSVRFNQGFSFLTTLLPVLGILGIGAVIFLFVSFILKFLKDWKNKINSVIFIGVSFLFISCFFYQASFSQMVFLFIGLGLLSVDSAQSFNMGFYSTDKRKNIWSFIAFLGTIVLLVLSLFFLYSTSLKYAAAVYYGSGIKSDSLARGVNAFEKAIKLNSQSDLYLRTLSQARLGQANELIQNASNQQNNKDVQAQFQNFIAFAVNAGRRATEINPIDAVNWSNLGSIYESIIPMSQAEKFAEDNYNKAIQLDPKNPQYFVDLARISVILADQEADKSKENKNWQVKLEKAKITLDKSVGLKSDYAPAHFLMAQIYVREGEIQKAIGKVNGLTIINPQDSGLAFQLGFLYYQNNQLSKAQSEFERAISLNENYSNARYFLGLIFDKKGQKEEAIEQFERIKKLNPDNQEIDKILSNLRSGKDALEGIVPPNKSPVERIETPISETEK